MTQLHEDKNDKIKPILVIDHLARDFGVPLQRRAKNEKNIGKSEENLLTLIANVIVEIILKEEL